MRGQTATRVSGSGVKAANVSGGAIGGQRITRRGMVDRLTNLPQARKVELFDTLCKAWGPALHEVIFHGENLDVGRKTARGGRSTRASNLQA